MSESSSSVMKSGPSCSRDVASARGSPMSFSMIVRIGVGLELNGTVSPSVSMKSLTNFWKYDILNNIGKDSDLTAPNLTRIRLSLIRKCNVIVPVICTV